MNIEINSTMLLLIFAAIVVFYLCTQKQENRENWTMLAGAPQQWEKLPRKKYICDTGFNDDECKFSAINCLQNPNSAFYMNE
jgi:hypothetical protein